MDITMGHLPNTAQFNRLASLGVTDAERALLAQRGHDREYIHAVITSAARYPLGSGALRYYRLFGEFPGAARSIEQLAAADHDAVSAWLATGRLAAVLEAVFMTGSWASLEGFAAVPGELSNIARAGNADAARNSCIEARIQDATVLLAGYTTAAKAAGRLGPRDHEVYVAPLPELLRRAARDWRALANRQRERALYRRSLWRAVEFAA